MEWSLCGIKWPSLSPESQSQSTPDSAGGLFTQPQRSISKSQKPAESNREAHTVHSHVHMLKHPQKTYINFLLSSFFFYSLKIVVVTDLVEDRHRLGQWGHQWRHLSEVHPRPPLQKSPISQNEELILVYEVICLLQHFSAEKDEVNYYIYVNRNCKTTTVCLSN